MNLNPFELMKNAKDLQTHFGKMQEELAALRVQGISGGGLPVAFVQRGVKIGLLCGEPNDAVFGRLMQDATQKFCRQGTQSGMQPAAQFQAAHGGVDERETCFPLPPAFRQVV